jgi:hypothetical protein
MAVLDRPVGTGFRLLRLELNAEGLAMLRVSPLWVPLSRSPLMTRERRTVPGRRRCDAHGMISM